MEDSRYGFLFGTPGLDWPNVTNTLAAFMRDILGLAPEPTALSAEHEATRAAFPFVDRLLTKGSKAKNITIVDLSLLAGDVLENVTALIGRLILEFLQRASDKRISGIERGEFPVVLILEEAQNYIQQPSGKEDDSISRGVYERIAREGRKYGLGLVVASQRPSELSRTVLSQCSTFIVHRLQNPEDLRYFREIVPGVYKELLEQLPSLSPQYALVLGEGVRAPSLLRVRDAFPTPRSRDPKFYAEWTADNPHVPKVEKVCAAWEGQDAPSQNGGNDPESPWAGAARNAVIKALQDADWDDAAKIITLHDLSDDRQDLTVATRKELEERLSEIATTAFQGEAPRADGDWLEECNEDGIVQEVLYDYEERLSVFFRDAGASSAEPERPTE
jgi:hypothetical protein